MNILIVTQYFMPESFRINEVAVSLSEKGHNVEIITGKPNYPAGKIFDGHKAFTFEKTKYKKLRIYRVPIITRGAKNKIRLFFNYLSFVLVGSAFSLFKLIRNKYNVIYVYGTSPILQAIPGIIFGKVKRIPVVLNVQDLWPESLSATGYIRNKFIIKIVDYIVCFIYKQSTLILVSSRPFKKVVKKYNTKAFIKYLPNSVDPIFLDQRKISCNGIRFSDSEFNIIFAGNLGSAQSIDTILGLAKGLKSFQKIKLYIFGDGSEFKYLNSQKTNQKLHNIKLMGRYPLKFMPYVLSKGDLLIATLSDNKCLSKTLPNKIQAYMSAKKPIVVSMNGEGARIINAAKCGIAVPSENIRMFIKAVLEIYNMSESERKLLGKNALNYFEKNFQHSKLIKKLENELIDLVQEK